jgi:hypothetical protein
MPTPGWTSRKPGFMVAASERVEPPNCQRTSRHSVVARLSALEHTARTMTLSPEVVGRIQAVEAKLVELDPILHNFCTRNGFTFSSQIGVWPRRIANAREEIDRSLGLVMDLTVPEVMERGFYPDMPWSLRANASVMLPPPEMGRILSEDVFHGLPFSQLATVLATRLEDGLVILRKISREDVIRKGQIHGRGA